MKTQYESIFDALEPGDIVWTLSESSSSNMTAYVRCFVVMGGEIQEITGRVCDKIKYTWNQNRRAIAVSGCGFDRSYDVVYALSLALFPEDKTGYKLKHKRM